MTFTPGPWACDFTSVWQEDGGGLIAVCGDAYPRGDNHPTENMRLISAAPDMYDALRGLITYFRGNNDAPCEDNSAGNYCLTHDAYKPCPWTTARAALAKADGR